MTPDFDAITRLANAVGVPGAALLIVSLGFALNIKGLFNIFTKAIMDWRAADLARDKFKHKAQLDGAKLHADIEDKKRAVSIKQGALK